MESLVINGCSYADSYAIGSGHIDLAQKLHIKKSSSIALSGSSNSRLFRTTAKHAYVNAVPTLYIIGLTFMSRWEVPIVAQRPNVEFEGKWVNPQAQPDETRNHYWTNSDTEKFTELNFKSVVEAKEDQFEDLIYRCLCLKDFLHSRNHRVLFFNQCGIDTCQAAANPKFDFLKNHNEFIEQLTWAAVPWQHSQGVPAFDYKDSNGKIDVKSLPPAELRHRKIGEHRLFNDYLTNYINKHKILS